MKQNISFREEYHACNNNSLKALLAGILFFTLLGTTKLYAQWTLETSKLFDANDLKNYTTSELPGSDRYIMAGTMFDVAGSAGDNGVHLMIFNNLGTAGVSNVLNDGAYDERAVGAHYITGNDIVIVASRMDATTHGLEVMRVDGGGNLLNSYPIYSADPDYTEMFPMGTLLYDNRTLLICGYMTKTLPTTPGADRPNYLTDKQAFVLYYDLNTNTAPTLKMYDYWTYPGAGPTHNDYDIAFRMKKFATPLPSGADIWIGGSCEKPTVPNISCMMNLSIEFNGGALDLRDDQPIEAQFSSDFEAEYSYDIMPEAGGTNYYVFSNLFSPLLDINNNGMDPLGRFYTIVAVDNALTRLAGNSRWTWIDFDYAYGVNTVVGNSPSSVIISGYTRNRTCNTSPATNPSNFNPFLAEYDLSISGTDIVVNTIYWKTVLSNAGTGNISFANSFYYLGDGYSNITWAPINTVRDYPTTRDIVLAAPVWNTVTDDKLNMKFVRTDMNGELSDCPWDPACYHNDFYSSPLVTSGVAETPISATVDPPNNPYSSLPPDHLYDCFTPYNKPGSGTTAIVEYGNNGIAATLYPNPATNHIRVKLDGYKHDKNNVRIMAKIVDITGKEITVIYDGDIKGLNNDLLLPNLSPGLYQVNIIYDGQQLKTLPLNIL